LFKVSFAPYFALLLSQMQLWIALQHVDPKGLVRQGDVCASPLKKHETPI